MLAAIFRGKASMSPRPSRLPFLVAAGFATLLVVSPARAEKIEVASKPVPLNPTDPKQEKVGRLTFKGGLALTSAHPRFGGLSALRLTEGGARISFISDEGSWVTARLVHDQFGHLAGLTDAELGPLLDLTGKALVEKEDADAESLAMMPDGSMVVGFEHHHRLWRYAATNGRLEGTPTVVPPPPNLDQAPPNGGIEALVAWGQSGLFALTEYWIVDDVIRGWTSGGKQWHQLGYHFEGDFRPSDMAVLPSGDVVVLERAYDEARNIVSGRLRQVSRKDVKEGATIQSRPIALLARPLSVDNFEGIDAVRGKKGETLLYLVSDDNFRAGDQRTLLLMFALDEP
jgi:hypothetical protein